MFNLKPNIMKLEKKRNVRKLIDAIGYIKDERITIRDKVYIRWPRENTIRWRAIDALGRIGDVRAVEPLVEFLKYTGERDNAIRCKAISALGSIGDERAIEPLLVFLQDTDKLDNTIRYFSIIALGAIGGSKPVEPLCKCLEDSNNRIRVSAAKSLIKIGVPASVQQIVKDIIQKHNEERETKEQEEKNLAGEYEDITPIQWSQMTEEQKERDIMYS